MKIHRGPLPPGEAERLAKLMAAAFTKRERGWSAAELQDLASQPGVVAVADADGFGILRNIAGEAEILTIAVAPGARGRGIGTRLVSALLEAAGDAARVTLEVAESNLPALSLYRRAGFAEAGRRRGYFRRADGTREDALVLLRPPD